MQPGGADWRPARMTRSRVTRTLLGLIAAGVLATVPVSTVFACSCATQEFPDAVRDADAAFVGRITHAVPQANGGPGGHVTYTFVVERARDAAMVGEVVSVGAAADEGMCGVRFEERARWLIVAYATGGMLETNGCLPNGPMDEAPPEFQATVTELLPFEAEESSVEAEGFVLPVPLVLASSAVLVVGLAGLIAFRRKGSI